VAPEQVIEPAAGWVYREDAAPEIEKPNKRATISITVAKAKVHHHAEAKLAEAKPAEGKPEAKPASSPATHAAASIPMFAIGMMAMSIGAFVYVGLFAVKTLNSPVRMATGILGRLRRA